MHSKVTHSVTFRIRFWKEKNAKTLVKYNFLKIDIDVCLFLSFCGSQYQSQLFFKSKVNSIREYEFIWYFIDMKRKISSHSFMCIKLKKTWCNYFIASIKWYARFKYFDWFIRLNDISIVLSSVLTFLIRWDFFMFIIKIFV